MGIAKKYNYNHPKRNQGDPRIHPDWEKWLKKEYYCKLDGHGYSCPECKYWWTCIIQLFDCHTLVSYMGDREVKNLTKKNEVKDLDGAEIVMLPIRAIRPNKFNCNVMDDAEYNAMKNDMKLMANPEGMAAVVVRELDKPEGKIEYEIIDGEHRHRAAGEINWKKIKTLMFTKEKMTQNQALILNFRINMQRGSHDPYKEAKFFNYLVEDQKKTQDEVAKLVNVNRSTVNKRISILKIDPGVFKGVPHGTVVPVSVLEIVAQAPTKKGQADLLKNHKRGSSVRDLEANVKYQKQKHQEDLELKALRKRVKFPKCPKCKKPVVEEVSPYWHKGKVKLLCCSQYTWDGHFWDPETGEQKKEPTTASSGTTRQKRTTLTRVFRSPQKQEAILKAARKAAKKAVIAYIDNARSLEMILPSDGSGTWYGENEISFKVGVGVNICMKSDQGHLNIRTEYKAYKDKINNSKVEVVRPEVTATRGTKAAENLFDKLMNGLLTFDRSKKKKGKKQ